MPFGDGVMLGRRSQPAESKRDDFNDDDFDSPPRKKSSSFSDIEY